MTRFVRFLPALEQPSLKFPCSQVSVSQVQEIREEDDNYIENSQVVKIINYAVTVTGQILHLTILNNRSLGSTRTSTSTMILKDWRRCC